MKNIGIKDKIKIYQIFIIAIFGIFTALTVAFWILFFIDIEYNNLIYNGIEAEAEIVGVVCDEDTTANHKYVFYRVYCYVTPEGKIYKGRVGGGLSKEQAESFIGEKVPIVIDPKGEDSTCGTLESLEYFKYDMYTDFPLACVFTGLFCVSSYLFFYRVIYRNMVDKKILKRVDARFINNCVSNGEVVKVLGLLWFYIKIKYQDEKGETQEKWTRSWFTRKEAKFLEQKKYINIVPYKNTYGILEEMPNTAKQKKAKIQ